MEQTIVVVDHVTERRVAEVRMPCPRVGDEIQVYAANEVYEVRRVRHLVEVVRGGREVEGRLIRTTAWVRKMEAEELAR